MPYHRPVRGGKLRGPAVAWVGLALAGVATVGAAWAEPAEPRVRVRLSEGEGAVRIVSPALLGDGGTLARARKGGVEIHGERAGARIRLAGPGPHRVDGRRYRGAIELRASGDRLLVVNEVPLESYVAGVLLGEVYASWEAPVLRAQAVAARTYALYRREKTPPGRPFHLEAGTQGQVYLGLDGESAAAWAAVRATAGEILVWDGEPILAAFHSSAGGHTASADEVWGERLPYLVGRRVGGEEDSPDTYWRESWSAESLRRALAPAIRVGALRRVRVVERSPSGRVQRLRVEGTDGAAELSGRELRQALGPARIRSTLFHVREQEGRFVFVGSGRGHGVGMSQWGARALAQRGHGYRAILARFYPGARLVRLPVAEPVAPKRAAAGGAP